MDRSIFMKKSESSFIIRKPDSDFVMLIQYKGNFFSAR